MKIHLELTGDQLDTLYFIVNTEVWDNIGKDSEYVAYVSRIRKILAQAKHPAKR